ncbi:pentapeptide repeat-containing protein [Deminuibacter soli]|uniref:Pentapeptide repeat-containing protein n=1 Tax=Deminuibacter soli TaxID=2291815 RepID=A0A3E1NJ56_9BACT|nr:pentapeptide repeat-containing protein [Deminuibacter soli]RFM27965.1 pentapeptide repeat-containing protein [Deminuibacter soli]
MEYYDQTFDREAYKGKPMKQVVFEQCRFNGIDFTGNDFTGAAFSDCTFDRCNLQMLPVDHTMFATVTFTNCKLNGINFGNCNSFRFEVHFNSCLLDYAYFFEKNMKKAKFTDCSIKQAHFVQCDLSGAQFNQCDLQATVFDRNNLQSADFSNAQNLSLDPEANKIKKAKFSLYNLAGLLAKYDIVVK